MASDNRKIVKAWLLVLQLGLTGIVSMGLCILAGLLIKNYSGHDYMLFFCILGIVSAVYSSYSLAMRQVGHDDETTETVQGMYDRASDLNQADDEDPLLEDYRLLNERREEELKKAGEFNLHENEQ